MLFNFYHKQVNAKPPGKVTITDIPPLYKEYPRFPQLPLPPAQTLSTTLSQALKDRASTRSFDPAAQVSKQDIATIAAYAAGECAYHNPESEVPTRRPAPSGGGLYPIELYVAVRKSTDVPPSIYHYNVRLHALEQITEEAEVSALTKHLGYPWSRDAAMFICLTAQWNRSSVRYGEFAYQFALLEAGHIMQNILLATAAMNIDACPLMGFNHAEIDTVLDVDVTRENVLYIAAVGKGA